METPFSKDLLFLELPLTLQGSRHVHDILLWTTRPQPPTALKVSTVYMHGQDNSQPVCIYPTRSTEIPPPSTRYFPNLPSKRSFAAHPSFVVHVALVADEDSVHVWQSVRLNLLHPIANVAERLDVGHVVHQEDAHAPSVVR